MVKIGNVTLEVRRTGETATFVCQGRPMGVAVPLTLPELEHLALYLANEVGLWRDALLETKSGTLN